MNEIEGSLKQFKSVETASKNEKCVKELCLLKSFENKEFSIFPKTQKWLTCFLFRFSKAWICR